MMLPQGVVVLSRVTAAAAAWHDAQKSKLLVQRLVLASRWLERDHEALAALRQTG